MSPTPQAAKASNASFASWGRQAGFPAWPHLLRHTYATQTLLALQRQTDRNRVEPLVFLQRQLGHNSIQTTMTYLHLVNELADEAVLAYDEELNECFDSPELAE